MSGVVTVRDAVQRHFISYPKSGRTWVRYILRQLAVDRAVVFHHDGFEFNDSKRPPHDFDLVRRKQAYARVDKIVYLTRQPYDTLVSLYHQVTSRFDDFFHYRGDLAAFIRDPYFGAVPLARFQAMWRELSREANVFVGRYEALHANLYGEVNRILDFLQLDAPPEAIAAAVASASFDEMRAVEAAGSFEESWLRLRNGAPKVREGRIGSHRDLLSDADLAFLDRTFADTTR
jgi:hypothetical protein